MADLSPRAMTWLADHHGVMTTAQLRCSGVGRVTQRRLVDVGLLRCVDRGVYVLSTSPASFEQRCAVECARHPSGFVTGPSAGRLVGLRRMPRTTAVHLSIHHGLHLHPQPGVRYRQTTVIWAIDRTSRADGIIVASPARLAFDLAADLSALDHLSVVEQLIETRRVTVDELAAIERRLGHPARPGSGRFAATLARLGRRPVSDSHPEIELAVALERRGVPIERQARVTAGRGARDLHVDLAVPAVRWGIELDIHPEHRTIEGHAQDAERRRRMHGVGWQVELVAEADLDDLDRLADELTQLYRRRATEVRSA